MADIIEFPIKEDLSVDQEIMTALALIKRHEKSLEQEHPDYHIRTLKKRIAFLRNRVAELREQDNK